MQLLYQFELSGDPSDAARDTFWADKLGDDVSRAEVRQFGDELVRRVLDSKDEIDSMIDSATSNWHLDRIARLDLSLLRLATCELLLTPSVPASVVINEAVDIAHKYCDEQAPAFVNGVLDRIARERGLLEDS